MKINAIKSLTSNVRRQDIVVIAVYLLGGDSKSVDSEDIAFKSNELTPEIFTWKKYPDQINLHMVGAFLHDAKKERGGRFLTGSDVKGWRLTSKGIDWINQYGKPILNNKQIILKPGSKNTSSVDINRKNRERDRITSTQAWKSWSNKQDISSSDLCKLFRINDYVTSDMIENKIVRLRTLFDDDQELRPFIREAAKSILAMGVNK